MNYLKGTEFLYVNSMQGFLVSANSGCLAMNPYASTVRYTELSSISFTDFTPSRATRESSNPVLQEHDPIEGIYATVCSREQRLLSFISCINTPLKGRYVELEFGTSTDSSNLQSETSTSKTPVFFRPHSSGLDVNSTAFGTSPPLRSRSRKEHNRLAFRIKKQNMDLPTFIVDEAEVATQSSVAGGFGGQGSPTHNKQPPIPVRVQKARVKKRRFSPPTLPPPPPPAPPHVEQATTCTAPPPVPRQLPNVVAHETNIVEGVNDIDSTRLGESLSASDNDIDSVSDTDSDTTHQDPTCKPSTSDAVPVAEGEDNTYPQAIANGNAAGEDNFIPPISRSVPDDDVPSNDHGVGAENENSANNDLRARVFNVPSPAPRKKLGSISETSSNPSSPAHSCCSSSISSQTGSPVHPVPVPRPRALSSQSELSQNARPPVPSPRKRSSTTSLDGCSQDAIHPVHTRQASEPELLSDMKVNFHSPSFLDIKAGQDCGQFNAEYMGSKECNSYLNSIESCAKQLLLNANAREVKVYVSSEKVRLSPPNASGVLYKSFAIKDILQVEKSKHKRIIGILTWKPKCLPECHAFRCSEPAIANALYESVWLQTQNLKRIKVNMPRTSSIECESSGNGLPSPKASPKELNSIAPSDLLHKFPVTLIGFTSAGKLQSVSDVIEKTLKDNKPSKAKEISVWISLAQVKLVDSTKNPEVIYATYDTSNIRAIGVSSNDNRFVGYTFKQGGKHLTCCVLWCHSAGLMVSLVSYLCQACQITFHQKGNSFHEDVDGAGDNCEGPLLAHNHQLHHHESGLLHHLQKQTSSQETSRSPSPISKSSASGTPPPLSRRVDSASPPSDISEIDDYSRFSLTYVGSATIDPPFTQQSVLDALYLFTISKSATVQVAAAGKNTVHMQVSATGINLTDQTRRLFITRNYPRKQVVGHALHPTEKDCFAFATRRPGLSDLKCHIFRVNKEATLSKVAEAITYWLDLSLHQ